jgi:hypothetical protein
MKNRSLFWPFILIAAGLVWLLIELRTLPLEHLWALTYIWPFFLMAVGVGLILRSRWPLMRNIVSGLIVLGMVLSVVFAPLLGWNKAPAWSSFHLGNVVDLGGSIVGSGQVVSESRTLADFDSIEIDYPVELTVQQGASNSLTIEAEDNLLPQLDTRISGNTLTIENSQRDWTKRVNPTRPVRMTLTVKTLQRVDLPSAGSLKVQKLQTDRLQVSISGAGSVTLSDISTRDLSAKMSGAGSFSAAGSADNLDVNISGLGSFQGDDLATQTAEITISGAGSATIWVKSDLNVRISGTGSVKYYGSPSVQRQISGLGSVNSLGHK